MKLTLQTPTKLYIDDLEGIRLEEVRQSLTYRDKKVQYELQQHKKAIWFSRKYGEEAYKKRLEELKAKEKVCLLNQDADGRYWVLSGMRSYLQKKYQLDVTEAIKPPGARNLPWANIPTRTPYPYQENAKARLLEAFHARVEMGTGLGKSFIILNLVKDLGLKTVIMAPSTSIAEQLYREFLLHFGQKYVGAFFTGKKDYKKLIVIGNGQSLTRVEADSLIGKELSKAQVFIADESHQCPASTLASVCTGICANASYRYFFSATQMRNDGLDLLLDAITGPTVFEMDVREGVDQEYLAKPVFRMISTHSSKSYESSDPNEMTREHLYYNPIVLQQAAEVINQSVGALGHQVLVLIDEVEQFTRLLPYLQHRAEFAHGPLGENKAKVPPKYHESDPNALVLEFNNGLIPILVGTSCISTGTDIKTVKTMVYLKGGKSEIEVKQGVGRCTRKVKDKTACTVVDFDVKNIGVLHRHAMARKKIYDEIYGPTEVVDWE